MNAPAEFLTSRSRRLTALRCPRARYWLDEWHSTGLERVSLAVPLLTGGSAHLGFASLLRECAGQDTLPPGAIDRAVDAALADYRARLEGRSLDLGELEVQSYVFNEQLALTEALVRLAGMRILPKLFALYEVLEVETLDSALLTQDAPVRPVDGEEEIGSSWRVRFRSIPDALLRARATGELFIASWKTTTEYSQDRDEDARVDMQGLSEPWALEARLADWWHRLDQGSADGIPQWFVDYWGGIPHGMQPPLIRGIQMIYLVKGPRRVMAKETMLALGLSAEQIKAGGKMWKQASPLIYGYRRESASGFGPPDLAWSSDWQCVAPHPMRKSQWYPKGECPGDSRTHKRGDEWRSFPVWDGGPGAVKTWLEALASGAITPEAGDALDAQYAIPVPHYRSPVDTARWLRQTRSAEAKIARDLVTIRIYEQAMDEEDVPSIRDALFDMLSERLDESFPQATEKCGEWFHRRCPCWELCHGPEGIRRDPLASGIYQAKTQYEPMGGVSE